MSREQPDRILIVDDEPSVLETLAAILAAEGYEVLAAGDVDTALALLSKERLDLVLTDLRMEGSSGLSLLGELRRTWPETLAIVLTGYASLESAIDALREGAYDYLLKPCDVNELKATVERALERAHLARSLTERVAELEAANQRISGFAGELQQRVEAATAQLSQKFAELSQAKQRLEELQHQREEFVSMIVHELNQPLTNITGHARLLGRSSALSERERRSLDLIADEGLRMARLLRDLADASRLATGDFTIAPVVCDAIDLIGSQVEMARASTERHSISFTPEPESLEATWDRDRITQVVSNLLKNAISHTDGGHIVVACLREGDDVVITVTDSGSGIPQDRMDAIFEPHVRLPGRPDAHGSGLGLYIARGIVETHGGRIWAGNVPGAGAKFTVMLPLTSTAQGALARG